MEKITSNFDAFVKIIHRKTPLFFYIFPVSDQLVNVSLGGSQQEIEKHGINLRKELSTVLKEHPTLAKRFTKASQQGNLRGMQIPYSLGNQQISGERCMLVGDAAGLANAFYKEGVGTGMMSGCLLYTSDAADD